MTEFFVAYIYLSRTLWLAYGSLNLISYILKKIHCEKYFHGIDPTWTAVVVAIVAGPFSYLQSRTEVFVQFYYFLFTFMANEDNELEAFFAAALYAFTIGTIPLLFGFLPDSFFTCRWFKTFHLNRNRRTSIQPSSYLNNNFKNRWALQLSLFSFKKTDISTQGGSVYKKHLGISQHGADCYVKWRSGAHVQPPIQLITSPQPCAFGKVNMQLGFIQITQGSNASPWYITDVESCKHVCL
ncbi:hypothetical protein THRCLA_22105 [Thraustotheca clavata]|uniref:Transmembrane protein n=1 Tax=Thraustotheca clavata TaxID=74557 RepID=A0A1V9ZC69_9STRA|nr:hypothetical protein THRCLA_22105 [Thraustotheca clavata]